MRRPSEEGWDQRVQWPLVIVSLLFLAAYAWPILDPDLSLGLRRTLATVVTLTWVLLTGEFVVRLLLARDRWAFLRHHPLDLAAAVLPFLRPLRLLRLLSLLTLLDRVGRGSLRGRVGLYVGASVSLIVLTGSLAVLDAERGSSGPIQGYGDALWWSLTTVTTVGYGDLYPVTLTGRVVAGLLMLTGIGVLGTVTAGIASWLVERVEDLGEQEDLEQGTAPATATDVQALREEVRQLRRELAARPPVEDADVGVDRSPG